LKWQEVGGNSTVRHFAKEDEMGRACIMGEEDACLILVGKQEG
jgi:hypothetical protein